MAAADYLDRFDLEGSPLCGRVRPRDWDRMDLNGKRKALVDYGIALDLKEAASLLGKHAAAVRRMRSRYGVTGRRRG